MLVWVQVPSPAVEKSRKSETDFLLFLCKHAGRVTNLPAVSEGAVALLRIENITVKILHEGGK